MKKDNGYLLLHFEITFSMYIYASVIDISIKVTVRGDIKKF